MMPTAVSPQQSFSSIAPGLCHTCGVISDGTTYCWGSNVDGQLGNVSNSSGWTIPVPVLAP